jgi:cellulose synthase/poly-beta-1,6-N-acetylglucosamine synthase-like glycosyltransferase
MVTLKVIFWICLALVFYTYLGYGILLWVLIRLKRLFKGKPEKAQLPPENELPEVTLMICAYNEQDIVDIKMENTHQITYPKLHVVWVTDGSNDATNDHLAKYPDVQVIFSPERRGKTAALNHGLGEVTDELVVMTDANTMLNPESITEIVRCFMDP